MTWTLKSGRVLHLGEGEMLSIYSRAGTAYLHDEGFSVLAEPAIHTGDQDYNEPGATPLSAEERAEISGLMINMWARWAADGKARSG